MFGIFFAYKIKQNIGGEKMIPKSNSTFIVIFISILLLITGSAFATIIAGSQAADWQNWNISDLNNNGMPYWDGASWDGTYKNIGYCLTSANCGLFPVSGTLQYWGLEDGTADSSFYFQGLSASNYDFTIMLELAGYNSTNIFGWYEFDPANNKIVRQEVIFNGTDSAGYSKKIIVSQYYGFFFEVPNINETYYTQSQFNSDPNEKGYQHFAVMGDEEGSFLLGMEDLSLENTDKDYNDMLVYDPPTTIPEPSTFLLVGTALIGVKLVRRRFK